MSLLASPWAIAILSVALVGAVGGSYLKGRADGKAIEFAQRATMDEVARVSREEATQAAANAIASIKVTHTTIRGKVEREVIREKDYSACFHSDATFGLLNAALANRAEESAGDSGVPRADAAQR